MALRLAAATRAAAGLRAMAPVPRVALASRQYSSETRPEPAQKAKSVIDALPGNNIVSKTGIVTLGTGAAAFAISKEIYVFNEETLILASFLGIATLLYRGMKEPIVQWSEGRISNIMNILTQARADHKAAVAEKIDSVAEMADVVDITKSLFAMSKSMAALEAEAYELKQRTAYVAEIKGTLDAWVRHETSVRERQQKELAEKVLARLNAALADPKIQADLVNQCIADIEGLAKKA
ncbi:atp4 subunit B of the stator stalk of mitochondrial F1F0 ATP synthase [Blastocladiella emersonii ATCC 22665]|nr:atp4 subunit B of the stator stalk of mitochondrial F1F0 ATP synthase [Blastocladiella emersonii ATCC 22665]